MNSIRQATMAVLVVLGTANASAQSLLLPKLADLDVMGAFQDSRNLVSDKMLRTSCTASPADRAHASFCLAYILGAVDAFYSSLAFQKHTDGVDQSKIEMCFSVPAGTSGFQIRDLVVKELSAQRSDVDFPASWTVGYALKKAFPCKP